MVRSLLFQGENKMMNYLSMLVDFFAMRCGISHGQRGATLIEYALIVAVIAVVVLVGGMTLSGKLTGFFDYVGTTLPQS